MRLDLEYWGVDLLDPIMKLCWTNEPSWGFITTLTDYTWQTNLYCQEEPNKCIGSSWFDCKVLNFMINIHIYYQINFINKKSLSFLDLIAKFWILWSIFIFIIKFHKYKILCNICNMKINTYIREHKKYNHESKK